MAGYVFQPAKRRKVIMRFSILTVLLVLSLLSGPTALGQAILSGRVLAEGSGSAESVPMTGILVFASLPGGDSEARPFRTWETAPVGWYHIPGSAGNYTMVFSDPAHFMRPMVMTNLYVRAGEKVDRIMTPRFDFADFSFGAWDKQPARGYYQPFVARGTSVTQVGFRVVHDGVDGAGPDKQDLVVSVHGPAEGTPEKWPQIGPAVPVLGVDGGGAKNYPWSAGWNSGEVPLVPGQTYAVCVKARSPQGTFQMFWNPDEDPPAGSYRVDRDGKLGFQPHALHLSVGTDGDGLLMPYNKRVHQEFDAFAGFGAKWSQTYVAQGRGLAGVILYAATGGTQPRLERQRAVVRIRRGGPRGPVVGVEKIAIGNGFYTGDASWGTFGAAFAPGEVPLVPGETYAVELQSIENYATLHGFVNSKGQPSDERPGFNPYRKCPPDAYANGTAYADGREAVDFDLDMQILEYKFAAKDWAHAVEADDLLINGDMEAGTLRADDPGGSAAKGWRKFGLTAATAHHYLADGPRRDNRILRVLAGDGDEEDVDGGYVQRVTRLSRLETYRLAGRVRSTRPVDDRCWCQVGYDPTGQDRDPQAATIVWTTLPKMHGVFVPFRGKPIRPRDDSISVWLRAFSTRTGWMPLLADFDDFTLQRVRTGVPRGK